MPFYSCKTDHMSITMGTTVVLMNIGINLHLKSNFKTPTGAQPNFLFGFFFRAGCDKNESSEAAVKCSEVMNTV